MGGLTNIVDAAFDRGKVAILALVVLAFIGLNTYLTAPRESDPDIPLPFVQVLVPLPGISPQDAERLLIRPAETELQSLEGLVQMDAQALNSAASIRLEFEVGMDMSEVLANVRAAIDRAKAEFPSTAQEPIVEEVNAQQMVPVITVILSGSAPERALFKAAKTLETRLTSLPGVLEVTIVGARDEVVDILISPQALENYGLTPQEVARAVQANNALIISGDLQFDDGAYTVKVPGLFKSLEDIRQIPLRADATNLITVGDVAEVRRTFEDPEGYARFDGNRAIAIDVSNRSGANLISVSDAVTAETKAIAAAWPKTIEVAFIGDMSSMVRSTFSSLTASIGLAIILVMIVVVAALGLRSALLVGIAIPSSFLIGLALIGFFGFTLNQLVMFSMVLAVGMLVDGAIVVVELADRRMAEGAERREAFMDASKRMFWPIIASTATTLAAFVPFLFWDSIEGYFMRWIPITLILVLSAALVVALIFLPIIGSNVGIPQKIKERFNLKGQGEDKQKVDLDNIDPTQLSGFTGHYARFIQRIDRKS
ncbi:MAG: efflux RND transporter permease subunit, partial [Pseudomonadota bacterium]